MRYLSWALIVFSVWGLEIRDKEKGGTHRTPPFQFRLCVVGYVDSSVSPTSLNLPLISLPKTIDLVPLVARHFRPWKS
jgi:hypothetical protein